MELISKRYGSTQLALTHLSASLSHTIERYKNGNGTETHSCHSFHLPNESTKYSIH